MQLYSFQFVSFLVIALAAYYLAGRWRPQLQWVVLLSASLVFYACSGLSNLVYVLIASLSCWACGLACTELERRAVEQRKAAESSEQKKAIKKQKERRKWHALLACLLLDFGVLFAVKYTPAIAAALRPPAADAATASGLLIPLGISFFTFQSVSYAIDVYNGTVEAERNFARYLLFVSWFPQLIQGPINRFSALAPQLTGTRRFDLERTRRSLLILGFGLLKKYAIANMLAPVVAAPLDHVTTAMPGSVVVFGILLYSAQQYADFSGGIDMVMGVSGLFGIEMAPNFRQPYFAVSLADFWRRWHISLGAWMRDYVFYPLALRPSMRKLGKWAGQNLGEHAGRVLPSAVANIVVFLFVGIWHGPELHYVLWGLYNGLVIAIADLAAPIFARMRERVGMRDEALGWRIFRIVRTFAVVNLGWYFDRIYDPGSCLIALRNTVTFFAPEQMFGFIRTNYAIYGLTLRILLAIAACLVVFIVSVLRERGVDTEGRLLEANAVLRAACVAAVAMMVIASFIFAPSAEGFLYANF